MTFSTLNWLMFIPVGIAVLPLGFAVFSTVMYRRGGGYYDDEFGWVLGQTLGYIFGGVTLIAGLSILIPFSTHYWSIYTATGVVGETTNSFVDGSGDFTFGSTIVRVEGLSTPLALTDPRLTGRTGDTVSVACSVEWVPYGADRFNCWIAD